MTKSFSKTQVPSIHGLPGSNMPNLQDGQVPTYNATTNQWTNQRLGGGSGTSGQVLTSNGASDPTWQFPPSRKNYIMNGNFDIWQKGTSFLTQTTDTTFADRWRIEWSGATGNFIRGSFTAGANRCP